MTKNSAGMLTGMAAVVVAASYATGTLINTYLQ